MSTDKQHLDTIAQLHTAQAERDYWHSRYLEEAGYRALYESLRATVGPLLNMPKLDRSSRVTDARTPETRTFTIDEFDTWVGQYSENV